MRIALTLLLFISLSVSAVTDLYPLQSKQDSQRFNHLSEQFRCLVCQNQSIAESSAPIAIDLRKEVYRQIQLGKSDQQIKDLLVSRFGDFVLFEPPVNKATYVLWALPMLLILLGGAVILVVIRKQRLQT